MSAPTRQHDRLKALAAEAGDQLEGAHPRDILRWAVEEFDDRLCITSSMADAVVATLASQVQPGIPVIFLDTGYHFAETIGTRDAVAATLPIDVITVRPRQTVQQQDTEHGARLYKRDPDLCCKLRKVMPLEGALGRYHAWASGIRRDESAARANTRVVDWDDKRGMVKINPLAAWTQDDVDQFIAENGVLVNPLVASGEYPSVGCEPCTLPADGNTSDRSGRWAGTNKTECGLHT
ncbi:MAG TPA: phosphoadenylyl-sulfate reductase [Mycobacteriales bacterium]|nr:phosphoadenylyl-sulfate reductase [Mycobacteriales bacterium]